MSRCKCCNNLVELTELPTYADRRSKALEDLCNTCRDIAIQASRQKTYCFHTYTHEYAVTGLTPPKGSEY